MGKNPRALLPHVMIEVDHTDKLTKWFASLWDCKGLNGLHFLLYGHNTVSSDMVNQVFKFVGAEALFLALKSIKAFCSQLNISLRTLQCSVQEPFVTNKRSSI